MGNFVTVFANWYTYRECSPTKLGWEIKKSSRSQTRPKCHRKAWYWDLSWLIVILLDGVHFSLNSFHNGQGEFDLMITSTVTNRTALTHQCKHKLRYNSSYADLSTGKIKRYPFFYWKEPWRTNYIEELSAFPKASFFQRRFSRNGILTLIWKRDESLHRVLKNRFPGGICFILERNG